ncbi:MAG TPA: P-loop NTPase [Micromonosporaceae bacterium]|jgi:pilus assembly protein CpaE
MTILFEPQRRDAQQLAVLLGSDVHVASSTAELGGLLRQYPGEMLVVLGTGVGLETALAVAAEYRVSRPAMGVVLVRDRLDVGLLGEAIRSGVREVVAAGDPAGLLAACARSLDVSRQMAPTSVRAPGEAQFDARIITVFAAKGGCGKTTLATNIAVALAAGGARRVGLIDLDLAFGDVAIMLQLVPERSIADAVGLGDQLDESAVRALITPYGPGLDTLLAPAGPAEAERVTQGLVADILRIARGMFDYLVVDTPPQFTDHVMTALDSSHVHVLATTPDIPSLKNLRIALDTFDLLDLPKENRVVVLNRADAKVGLTASDIERVIRVPIMAHVPSSRDVSVSINRGVPIMVDNPQHPVSKAIRDFALGRLTGPTVGEPPLRGLRALLNRGR